MASSEGKSDADCTFEPPSTLLLCAVGENGLCQLVDSHAADGNNIRKRVSSYLASNPYLVQKTGLGRDVIETQECPTTRKKAPGYHSYTILALIMLLETSALHILRTSRVMYF